MLTVCWAASEAEARATALEWWPNGALRGPLSQELPLLSHFEEAAAMVDEGSIAEAIVCGPDPEAHLSGIREFADAGFDHVYVHQVGPIRTGSSTSMSVRFSARPSVSTWLPETF